MRGEWKLQKRWGNYKTCSGCPYLSNRGFRKRKQGKWRGFCYKELLKKNIQIECYEFPH